MSRFLTIVTGVVLCWTVRAVVTRGIATPHAIFFRNLRLPVGLALLVFTVLLPVVSNC